MNTQKQALGVIANQKSLAFMLFILSILLMGLNSAQAKSRPMTAVLQEFTDTYEVLFSYDPLIIEPLEVEFNLQPQEAFEAALKRLLKPFELSYESFGEKFCVIFKKEEKKERKSIAEKQIKLKTPNIKLEGKIVDAETGEKVPFASIKYRGANQHTAVGFICKIKLPLESAVVC